MKLTKFVRGETTSGAPLYPGLAASLKVTKDFPGIYSLAMKKILR